MLSHCPSGRIGDIEFHRIVADEEVRPSADRPPKHTWRAGDPARQALPFAGGSLDLIVSNLCLHWINAVPGK
jgi:hypothetical protein